MQRTIITTGDGSKTIHLPDWNENYHSSHGAVQEAKHVFLKHGLDLFLAETNIFSNVKSDSIGVKLFNTLCKAYRKREKDGKDYYVITGYNPFNFKVIKTKKSMNEDDLFNTLKSYF